MQKTITNYNHSLSQKLTDKAIYENELEDENENFDLFKYLYEEAK